MAGYTRQSSSNIQPGEIVKSGPVNNEFNAIRDAFNKTSGHKHDGTTAEGAYIPEISDTDNYNKVVIDTTNNRIGFFSEVSSAAVEQVRIQDGVIVPVTDNDIDLGTSSLEFKDLFIDGTATIDTLTVDESATITANLTVNGNTTLGNAASDTVTLTADVASAITPSADDTHDLGAVGSEWRNLYVDGQALIDDLVADTADINGGNIDATVIGASTAAAGTFTDLTSTGTMTIASVDINGGAIDGVTIGANSAGAGTFTTVTASGAVVINGGLTMDTDKFTVADTSGNTSIGGTLTVSGATTLAATSFGDANITNVGDIALDSISADGSTITITGNTTFADGSYNFDVASHDGTNGLALGGTVVTASAAELNIMDGVTATTAELNIMDGVTSTTAELNILDGVTSTAAELNILDGVTATATEINILDGDTSATSTTVADADRVVLNDNGTMVQVAVTDLAAYFDDEITAMPNLVTTAATTVGALNSGSITSGFGTIDTGSSTITTTGNITGGNLIISDGGNIGSSSDTDAISIASSGNVTMTQDLTVTGNLTVNGSTSTISSTNTTIEDALIELGTGTTGTPSNDAGIVIERGSADNAFIGYDESADKFIVGTGSFTGASTGNLTITTGTLVANVEGNVTGNVTGSSGSTTGNAATATALETARTIGGVSFDGTANINLPGVNASGTQDTSGNAATATALETARTIAGQSFDGTGNITIAPTDLTGVTSTATELNVMDGDTSATSTTLADADRVVVNDAGTMKQVALTDFETYFEGALDTLSNVTTVGALNSGSITSGFGAIDNGSSNITTSGTIQFGSLSDGTVTVTDIADEDNFSSNSATKLATQQSIKAYVDSTAGQANNVTGLTATGTELNTVADASGVSIDTSTAVAANDALLLYDNSGSSIGYFDVDLLDTYFSATTKTLTNKTLTSPTVSGLYLSDAGLTIEGSSANSFETVLNVTDPTADRTITLPDATGTVALTTGTAFTGDVTFGDSNKAIFGAGSDLQIYHDGSNSYISDQGTGGLKVLNDSWFYINNSTDTETKAIFKSNGAVELYYDNSLKFETTNTGVDVTGTVTADGLTVNSGTDNEGISVVSTDAGSYVSVADNGTTGSTRFGAVSNDFKIDVNSSERLRIDSSGNVGVGTASPNSYSGYTTVTLNGGTNGSVFDFERSGTIEGEIVATANAFGVGAVAASGVLTFRSGGNTERMRISSGGVVAIGNTSPKTWSGNSQGVLQIGNTGAIELYNTTDDPFSILSNLYRGTDLNYKYIENNEAARISFYEGDINFATAPTGTADTNATLTTRLKIENGGNVGIGTDSPSGLFHAKDSSSSFMFKDVSGNAKIFLDGSNGDFAGGDYMEIEVDSSPNLMFKQAGTERMRIDSSGNLLLGTTSLNTGTLGASNQFAELAGGSTGSGTLILSRASDTDASEIGGIRFANANNADDDGLDADGKLIAGISGRLETSDSNASDDSGGHLVFYTKPEAGNYAERLRIDSSGNLLVGTTDTSLYNNSGSGEGMSYFPSQFLTVATSGQETAIFNRLSSDGTILQFRKDGSTVGSIGSASSSIYVGSGDTGLLFLASGDAIRPADVSSGSSTRDNAIDLGASVARFKDGYFSANLYANALIHDGDTNTKIEFNAADQISFETGGSQRAYINNSDFVVQSALKEDYDALSGTTPTIDVDVGGAFSLTMSGNTTFTFSSCTSGVITGFVLQLTGNGGTVTYPASVDWAGGTAPDAPANGETDILVFITRDGGTTWYGALSIDAAA